MSGDHWLWTGAVDKDGYGQFKVVDDDGVARQHKAHRVAYQLSHGPIPEGADVLHHCDTENCVRPSHLFPGSSLDNRRDWKRKRAQRIHPRKQAKLSPLAVRAIRESYASGGVTQRHLAAAYGVNQATIGRIVRREAWDHVP